MCDKLDRNLTAKPHLAGTDGELRVAQYIGDTWRAQGLSPVRLVPYEILLSFPDKDDPSKITLFDENNKEVYVTQLVEKILRPEQNQSDVVPPFNVYSPPGHIRVLETFFMMMILMAERELLHDCDV